MTIDSIGRRQSPISWPESHSPDMEPIKPFPNKGKDLYGLKGSLWLGKAASQRFSYSSDYSALQGSNKKLNAHESRALKSHINAQRFTCPVSAMHGLPIGSLKV